MSDLKFGDRVVVTNLMHRTVHALEAVGPGRRGR